MDEEIINIEREIRDIDKRIEAKNKKKTESSNFPHLPNPNPNPNPYLPPQNFDDGSKKIWIIGGSFILIILILGLIFIYSFYSKDFSEFIKIDNKAPEINVSINQTDADKISNTFVNNITVVLSGDIAKSIANQTICEVKKQLNQTC